MRHGEAVPADMDDHTLDELRLMRDIAAGFDLWDNVEEIDRRIAAACPCRCHRVVQPGLIPCPHCEGTAQP